MLNSNPVLLRPHHGMCLFFFTGEGYSTSFAEHMRKVGDTVMPGFLSHEPSERGKWLRKISCDNAAPVCLVTSTDEICSYCPLNIGGVCRNREKVLRFDIGVLKACGLREGTVIRFSDLADLIIAHIFVPGLRETICRDCQWSKMCRDEDCIRERKNVL